MTPPSRGTPRRRQFIVFPFVGWLALSALPFGIWGEMGVMPWGMLNFPLSGGLYVPTLTDLLPRRAAWIIVVTLINASLISFLATLAYDIVVGLAAYLGRNGKRGSRG